MYAISSEKNEDEIVRVHSYKNAHSVQIMWFIPWICTYNTARTKEFQQNAKCEISHIMLYLDGALKSPNRRQFDRILIYWFQMRYYLVININLCAPIKCATPKLWLQV